MDGGDKEKLKQIHGGGGGEISGTFQNKKKNESQKNLKKNRHVD